MPHFSKRPRFITLSFLTLIHCLAGCLLAQAQEVHLASPQKRVQVTLTSTAGGLRYSVWVKGQTAIEPSPLGISVDDRDLGQNAALDFLPNTFAKGSISNNLRLRLFLATPPQNGTRASHVSTD